jgi:hypothetical protein
MLAIIATAFIALVLGMLTEALLVAASRPTPKVPESPVVFVKTYGATPHQKAQHLERHLRAGRYRTSVAYTGEDGILPGTAYRITSGKFVAVKS